MTSEASAAEPVHFLDFLRSRGGALTTDDTLATLLPLFRQVLETHAAGRVAPLDGLGLILVDQGRAYFETAQACEPQLATQRIQRLETHATAAFEVVAQRVQTTDADVGDEEHKNLLVADRNDALDRPLHVVGYASWEHLAGHHDALTDIYSLGLLLASVACGFDFTERAQLETFVRTRRNLFAVRRDLNPVLAKTIVRLTELGRHQRAQDLDAVIRSLERYRDQQLDLDLDLARIPGFHTADLSGRRKLVLARLRERLFEISRRNRLLYFKPGLQSLNLTFASVPILLDVKNVRAEQIFSWHPEVEKLLADGAAIPLARYLRFEDAPYLPSVLDKLASEARRDTAEFGFSQLRLVIAFLRWHNLKENAEERIDSPLLLLPVELTKKKGVRDSYVMRATSDEAEVNPVLRYHLKQLYDIDLPHSIDLTGTTIKAFHEALAAQIQASEPGVVLNLLDRPQVELVYQRARRRLEQYRRRLRVGGLALRSFRDLDYSYSRDNYQPLGLRAFVSLVRPSPAPLHNLFERERPVRQPQMAASAPTPKGPGEREKLFVSFREGGFDGNAYSWDFDLCNLTLGNFHYRKMSLVRDYDSLLESGQTGAPFDALFSPAPRPAAPEVHAADLSLRFPVVACDPTQLRALAMAETGASYIIQGPPGTGKSQTITNLIADLVAQGKRLLFVCEKRAAIDVVYHRLRQRGLHDLVCLIHDSQADKREFILDLKASYEGLLGKGDEAHAGARRRARRLDALRRDLQPIETFERVMREPLADSGVPLRQLLVRLIALAEHVPELAQEEEDDLPPYREWAENGDALEHLRQALRDARLSIYGRHPLAALDSRVGALERPRAQVEERLRGALAALARIQDICSGHKLALGDAGTLETLSLWARYAAAVQPLAERGLLGLMRSESPDSARLRDAVRERRVRLEALDQARQGTSAWRSRLEPADLEAALAQARALEAHALRFLSGSFWRLRRVLRERYDFTRHAVRPSWTQILERLQTEYTAADALRAADTAAQRDYGADQGLDSFAAGLEGLRRTVRDLLGNTAGSERDLLRGDDPNRTVRGLLALQEILDEVQRQLNGVFEGAGQRSLGHLRTDLQALLPSLGTLRDFLPCLAALSALPTALARTIREQPLELPEIEAALVARAVGEAWRHEREAARFGGSQLELQAERIRRSHDGWLEANAEVVLQRVRERFRENVARASLPSIRLTREQDEFKRRYNAGRRELEHEFGKSMRYKSVRGLLAGPAGEVILDLKPVWLMSPLSVSDTLPIEAGRFDVVIYDEASQIPLEEAVPTLFRAEQVIVSGDQMQLPPTNFFSATRSGEDNLLLEDDEDGSSVEYELDSNSFLSHAARNLPSTLLGWHYRSRSESLISFSNAAFYDGRLLTVPERALQAAGAGEIRPAAAEEGFVNTARLLERPVSFHHLAYGRYDARRNPAEAAYIAQLVRGLLAQEERLSVGIVAFSEAQQTSIEAALERLAETDADFRGRIEQEYEREENGQFAGLLVKNLENIQGDERDVILLSVCYGYGPDGRMLMNFGPINQSGGEKRLNVAFSRAKRHMAVISSIQYGDIKNVYNDGANALRSYLQYAAAMSAGETGSAATILRAMSSDRAPVPPEERAPDAVVVALAAALRKRGLEVESAVGQSHFRCHLAIRRAGDPSHRLAVFVDTDAHYDETDILEREVLKPGLLRSFGWTVCPVLTKDWVEDPAAVLDRIEKRLDGEQPELPDEDAAEEELAAPESEAPPSSAATDSDPAENAMAPAPGGSKAPVSTLPRISTLLPDQKRCFEYVAGSSSKFWHVTVSGSELVVVFGRIGNQGQVKRKAYPTPELACSEAEQLIREKLGKGYQEVS